MHGGTITSGRSCTFARGGRVLDQLDQLVFVDHRALA